MALRDSKNVLLAMMEAANKHKIAIGAFNFHDLTDGQGILAAAEELQAPVILMASEGAIKFAGLEYIVHLFKAMRDTASVPVALHMDHGKDLDLCFKCIEKGFTSVMLDASDRPFAENVEITKRVVTYAKQYGVAVEGELGRIGGVEDDISVTEREANFTDPDAAAEYVAKTQVDLLAVAIGTAHGFYKGVPQLDFDRLAKIHQAIDIPLVLHGGTGVPDADFRRGIELGIRKINVGTELKNAYTATMRQITAEKPLEVDPRKILIPARQAVKEAVMKKITVFGMVQVANAAEIISNSDKIKI